MIRQFRTLVLVILGIFTFACSSTPENDNSESVITPRDTSTSDYIIGPGDTLQVFVWRNPEITVSIPVRPDGRISTPLVEDMVAVGKTPTQLARDIEQRIAKYIRNPEVTIIVTNFVGSFSQQVRVIGQAARPQALTYRENLTLLDVMIQVGGLTNFASGNSAKVIRSWRGVNKEIPVRLADLIQDGDISANLVMRPGDILIIPESWF